MTEQDTREKLEADVRQLCSTHGWESASPIHSASELILAALDRQALITEREMCAECDNCEPMLAAIREIRELKTERTCKVKQHGYLIIDDETTHMGCWSCSECSYGWHVSDYDKPYSYCPHCGRKVVNA